MINRFSRFRHLTLALAFLAASIVAFPSAMSLAANSPNFPLRISANHRYLVDQDNKPVFLNGEAAWSLLVQLDYRSADLYLTDRASRGFNTVLVNLIEHKYGYFAPATINRVAPFGGQTFVTPNELYFTFVDSILTRASELGFTVLLCPLYLGYDCGDQGWCAEIRESSDDNLRTWGTYVGNHFSRFSNIVWVIGGDTDPTPVQSKVETFVAALQRSDSRWSDRLITTHSERKTDAFTHFASPWINLNSIYTSFASLQSQADSAYRRAPTTPFFLIESDYENESGTTEAKLRAQAYWSLLSGSCGHIFGNCPIWGFNTEDTPCSSEPWQQALGSPGSLSMTAFSNLLHSRSWSRLIPDSKSSAICATDRTAFTDDSTCIIGFLASAHPISINPSLLTSEFIRVWWYQPQFGFWRHGERYPKSVREYTPPRDGDWVIVIDTASAK